MKFKTVFIKSLLALCSLFLTIEIAAQSVFDELEIIKDIPTLSVKSQGKTGTCWSFGTTSFIESELIRMGKGKVNLSEMFTVRCAYQDHAELYLRYHGYLNFGPGAQGWDVFNAIKKYGLVPRGIYPGLKLNPDSHDHGEMDKILKAMVDVLIESRKLSNVWNEAIYGVLDAYLGKYPEEFEYNGKKYTPKSFRDYLEIDPDNYQAFTSVNHRPYYTNIVFESPDNWSSGLVTNIEMNDLVSIIENSLLKGYTLVWASDVSDPGFNHKKGLAIVPEKDWVDMSLEEKSNVFEKIVPQKEITVEMRQSAYNNYETTDDHLMHIVGLAKDKNGTRYFKVKNSWGDDSNELGGYFFVSDSYIKLRTMTIAVHTDVIPKEIKTKLKNR